MYMVLGEKHRHIYIDEYLVFNETTWLNKPIEISDSKHILFVMSILKDWSDKSNIKLINVFRMLKIFASESQIQKG